MHLILRDTAELLFLNLVLFISNYTTKEVLNQVNRH